MKDYKALYEESQKALKAASKKVSNDVHVITSDLIESDFGLVKQRLQSNKRNGFTAMILMLPLYPRLCRLENAANYDVKTVFEGERMRDLKSFRLENLKPNPNIKRTYKLTADF